MREPKRAMRSITGQIGGVLALVRKLGLIFDLVLRRLHVVLMTLFVIALPVFIVMQAIKFQRSPSPTSLGDKIHGLVFVIGMQAIFAISLLLAGLVLYAFRCQSPFWYGRLEVLVGLLIGTYVVNAMLGLWPSEAAAVFTTIGALYIIVRGCDNIYKSKKAGTADIKWWNQVFFFTDTDAKL